MAKPAGTPRQTTMIEQGLPAPTGRFEPETPVRTRIPAEFFGTTRNADSFDTYQIPVVISGTPVQLPNISIPDGFKVNIRAKRANTGLIYVGNQRGRAIKTNTTYPYTLAKLESIALAVKNANLIWIDADISGEGVDLITES